MLHCVQPDFSITRIGCERCSISSAYSLSDTSPVICLAVRRA